MPDELHFQQPGKPFKQPFKLRRLMALNDGDVLRHAGMAQGFEPIARVVLHPHQTICGIKTRLGLIVRPSRAAEAGGTWRETKSDCASNPSGNLRARLDVRDGDTGGIPVNVN